MKSGKRQHSAQFKAKVALEAIKGLKTTNELARPSQLAGCGWCKFNVFSECFS